MQLHTYQNWLGSAALLDEHLSGRVVDSHKLDALLYSTMWRRHDDLPDHVLKSQQQYHLHPQYDDHPANDRGPRGKSIAGMLFRICHKYSQQYFERQGGKLYIKLDQLSQWQGETSHISPAPFIAYHLFRLDRAPNIESRADWQRFLDQELKQFRHSYIITPHLPIVEDIGSEAGFYDTHMHLNGTTEAGAVWQDSLLNYTGFAKEIHKADRKSFNELCNAISPSMNKKKFLKRIRLARRYRLVLCALMQRNGRNEDQAARDRLYNQNLVRDLTSDLNINEQLWRHPVLSLLPHGLDITPLQAELIFWIKIFETLESGTLRRAKIFAGYAHIYLLILNANFMPLTVQRQDLNGFDQFQKFTRNGIRERVEKGYVDRFHQLAPHDNSQLARIEGRFAPKESTSKNKSLLKSILKGFHEYHGATDPFTNLRVEIEETERLRLCLTAHFIKEPNKSSRYHYCQYESLRKNLKKKWRHFERTLKQYPLARKYVTAIDAAANELDTPPEVFAPLFRKARAKGFQHFTYHVGEDFRHLLSGIRAIKEAVIFLGLSHGNRIGHGTAIGIDPALWISRMPPELYIPKQEWLDNLIFAVQHLSGITEFQELVQKCQSDIFILANELYGEQCLNNHTSGALVTALYQAWKLRDLDATLLEESPDQPIDAWAIAEKGRYKKEKKEAPNIFALWCRYHSYEYTARGSRLTKVECDYFPADALRHIQSKMLRELKSKEIVIEAMISSNVSISVYKSYKEHHILRWLGLNEKFQGEDYPPITLATDDPGIFNNNIQIEMAHLFRLIKETTALEHADIKRVLSDINANGRIYGFTESIPAPVNQHG